MAKPIRDMTEPELAALMSKLARRIDGQLPDRELFAILVFDGQGIAQYVSNASRKDIIRAMRAMADRLESRENIERVAFREDRRAGESPLPGPGCD